MAQGKGTESFTVGTPSWVLQLFGTSSIKPLTISRRNFVHVLFGVNEQDLGVKGKHGLSAQDLQGLVVGIQRPIAAFKSSALNAKQGETAIVLLTELQKDGKNIVAPIHLTYRAKDGRIRISNRIPSTYDKNSIKGWINKGLLLGYEKTKGFATLLSGNEPNARNPAHQIQDLEITATQNPLAGAIVYENDTLVADLYQTSATPTDPLVTIHNIRETGLLNVNKLGALPVPSLAVTKVGNEYSQYGEISLIGTKGMVDPGQTPVFSADAYTARFFEINWTNSVDRPKAEALAKEVKEAQMRVGDSGTGATYYLVNSPDRDRAADALANDVAGMVKFLNKGIKSFKASAEQLI